MSFFCLINTKEIFVSFLAAGFCLKNLAFAGKIMALPESGELQPPGSYTFGQMLFLTPPMNRAVRFFQLFGFEFET